MSSGTTRKSRRNSHKKTRFKRRPLRIEPLEPRIALSAVGGEVVLATVPPAPDWAIAPYTTSPTSISMTATTVDVGGEAEYFFTHTTDDTQNSEWQSSTTYVAWNLAPETEYGFKVMVRKVSPQTPEDPSEYSTVASATTQPLPADAIANMTTVVTNIANQIRAIETFSNPDNPGQITGQLQANDYPDPTAANTPSADQPPINGLAAYSGDGRNTPGAFQVDLANMSVNPDVTPPTSDWFERFGEWKGTAGSKKDASPYDTQIAFSAQTLHDYFNIDVDANGLITRIEAPAASVFLHDDALANASLSDWNPDDNPLVGFHIDNFQLEQLSLYLAGRDSNDSIIGLTDSRKSPQSVMDLSQTLQYQTSNDYTWGSYRDALSNWAYRQAYRNATNLFGAKLEITSSTANNIFGINKDEVFYCQFNSAFIIGGMYVSGAGTMNSLLIALLDADATGSGTWIIDAEKPEYDVHFTRTQTGPSATDKVFTVDKTPMNHGNQYPTIFHYGAVMSPFGVVDQATLYMVGVADVYADAWGYEGRNVTDGLGYVRLTEKDPVTGSKTLTEGGRYSYKDLEAGKTLTLTGAETFVIVGQSTSAAGPNITSGGYNLPENNSQSVSADQVIDIADFYNNELVNNNTETYNSSFYVWWDADQESHVVRVSDPTFKFSDVPNSLYMYFAPAAQDKSGLDGMIEAMKDGTFGGQGSTYGKSARVVLVTKDAFGKPTSADQWATHFATEPLAGGTGVIDASQATGQVLIIVDDTIKEVKLGSGCTTVLAFAGNTAQKTYELHPNATDSPVIDLRSGDVFSGDGLAGLTWTAGDATTFDNNVQTTSSPYIRYSYFAGWTGKQGSVTKATFQAIVRAKGTADTDKPENIIDNALRPLEVTINRASAQADQTSASLMSYTVVFSEEVADFNVSDVKLSGPAATVDGASIVVTNPSGDQITYSVTVTLKDTASMGSLISTIVAGDIHDAEGFANHASTSTFNTIAYKPNAITGRETSNGGLTLAATGSNGEPLPGVRVSLYRSTLGFTGRTTTTDSDGYYWFENVPDGTYQVTVTPPNACINTGANTTVVSAEGSQTYEADFSIGALKPGYIPNRMMVTSSLPVGSIQWRQVVREALNIGEQTSSQSAQLNVAASQPAAAQYLVLATQSVNIESSDSPIANVVDVEVVNIDPVQTNGEPKQITQAAITPIIASSDAPIAEAGEVAVVSAAHIQADGESGEITQTSVAPNLASNAPIADAGRMAVASAAHIQADVESGEITQTSVAPIVQESITRWAAAGLEQEALNKMRNTTFVVSDLPELYLGMARDSTVWLDWDAAGRGWFVDQTPNDDKEFDFSVSGGPMQAIDPQILDRIDLLTVVSHELGHIAGLTDSDISDLMGPSLEMGLRLIPSAHDAALASI